MPLRAIGIDPPVHELKAELFRALAHPARVRVLELLVDGERPVSELLAVRERMLADLGLEPSHLSQHLATLRRAGVVVSRRQANTVTYRLADESVAQMLAAARPFLVRSLTESAATLAALDPGRP